MTNLFTCLSKKSLSNGNGSGLHRDCIGYDLAISRKLFVSILFLLLLFGVGNAWGATTGTITFGSGSGDLDISSSSVYGNDSQSNRWDVTVTGSSVYYGKNADYSQVGSESSPASTITFQMTLGSSQTISAFSATFSGTSKTKGTVTLKVGSTTVGTGSIGNGSVVVSNTTWTAGTVLTVEVTSITAGIRCHSISYTYGETMRTVAWKVNKDDAEGSPTTSVPNGAKVLALPTTPTSSDCDGEKVFVGWSATELDDPTDTKPSDLFTTQPSAPAVTGDVTYYAVFATATAGAGDWELYTESSIEEGDYLIVELYGSYYYAMNNTVSSTKLGATSVTVSDNTITYSGTTWTPMLWHIKETATSGVYTIKNGDNYVVSTGTASQANLAASPADNKELFTITYSSDTKEYTFENKYNANTAKVNATLRYAGSNYACYAAASHEPCLFKRGFAYSSYATTCCTNKIAAPAVTDTKTAYTVSLSWTAASGVSKYEVKWNNGDWEEVTTSIEKTSLSPNTTYTWEVRAKTWSGEECGVIAASGETTTNSVYTVTYAAGTGGSGTMTDSNSPYEEGDEVTVLENTFTRNGYSFNEWSYSPAQSVEDGKFTMGTANVTITATWTSNTDQFKDYIHGNTIGNKTGNYGTMPAALSDETPGDTYCEEKHYKFIGWVLSTSINDDGTLKNDAVIVPAGDGGHYATNVIWNAVWADEEQ